MHHYVKQFNEYLQKLKSEPTVKVTSIEFNTKRGLPIFILEDGSRWLPMETPTGGCWALSWIESTKIPE